MHPLDIISNSPNLYILQKGSNKTNFGGFLFLLYLLVTLLIFIIYIIDYVQNDKYIIQSFSHFNLKTDEEIQLRNTDELYNQNINFKLDLRVFVQGKELYLDEKFKLYDNNAGQFIERNKHFNKKITEFEIYVLYECDNFTCSEYDDFLKIVEENDIEYYYLRFQHDGFFLDHQNKEKPIIKTKDNGKVFGKYYRLNINKTTDIVNYWKNIIYTEKKGFFQKDSRDSCGYIEKWDSFSPGELITTNLTEVQDKSYKYLSSVEFQINNMEYTEYFRKRISELDIIANILSLIANIFTGVKFVFSFYSDNFNNFKIIEKLLDKKTSKKIIINKSQEMNDLENKKFISIKDDLKEKCIDNENKENEYNEDNNNSDDPEQEKEDELSTNSTRMKKLRFFDFFLNNLYNCCKKQKPQKIIHTCNQIVYKYASIDNLIKNQILMENFLKDYKWNDPSLNNVENNDLFIQLKTYL